VDNQHARPVAAWPLARRLADKVHSGASGSRLRYAHLQAQPHHPKDLVSVIVAFYFVTMGSLTVTAASVRAWRKARREVSELRLMYWTAMGAVRETHDARP
jgi:hypothetical protein